MKAIERILVAVDGSDESVAAADRALDLARRLKATVTVAHAVVPVVYPPEAMMAPTPELEQSRHGAAMKLLDEVVSRLDHSAGPVPLEKLVLSGGPAESLVDHAEKNGFDLIVVGPKGKGAIARLMLGSVADRVVHLAKVPVLVVH